MGSRITMIVIATLLAVLMVTAILLITYRAGQRSGRAQVRGRVVRRDIIH